MGLTGTISMQMHQSMVLLPEEPMMPRVADNRVGYFSITQVNFGLDELKAAEQTFIRRWRLEPSDPEAYARGEAAVDLALAGKNAVMPVIRRLSDDPYRWEIAEAALADVANVEKKVPRDFITEDGFGITEACREYLYPLIQGEAYPDYDDRGMPRYVVLKNELVEKKLPSFDL